MKLLFLSLVILSLVSCISAVVICPNNGVCNNQECFQNCAGRDTKFLCPNNDTAVLLSGVPIEGDTLGELVNQRMEAFMPGSNHLAQGYNIVEGKESGHPVFLLRYCGRNPDASHRLDYGFRDNKYRIPDSLNMIPKPSCSLDSSTSMFKSASQIANKKATDHKVSISLGATVDAKAVKVAASASFSKDSTVSAASDLSSSDQHTLAITTALCTTTHWEWSSTLDLSFGFDNLHPQFEQDLNKMASVADAADLVEKYGSHFYKWAVLGGQLQQMTALSDQILSNHSEDAVSSHIEAAFSTAVSGKVFFASGGIKGDGSLSEDGSKDQVSSQEFDNNSQTSSVRSTGGAPFNVIESDWTTWANSIDVLPVAVDFELEEILNILPNINNAQGLSIRDTWASGVLAYLARNGVDYPDTYSVSLQTDYIPGNSNQAGYFALEFAVVSPTIKQTFAVERSQIGYDYDGELIRFSADGTTVGVALDNQNPAPVWDKIIASSYSAFLNKQSPGSVSTVQPLSYFPVDHISVFFAAKAKEYMYLPFATVRYAGDNATLDPTEVNSFYRSSRWFYEIRLIVSSCSTAQYGFLTGLFSVSLTGDLATISSYIDISSVQPIRCDIRTEYITFKLYSDVSVGALSSVSVRTVEGSTQATTIVIPSIVVVDLDDNVFESHYAQDIVYSVRVNPYFVKRDFFTAALYPKSGYGEPSVRYGYQLNPKNNAVGHPTYAEAERACLSAGAVLASPAQLLLSFRAGGQWNRPSWTVDPFITSSTWQCYFYDRAADKLVPDIHDATKPGCGVQCFGALPSALNAASYNVDGVVAVAITYGKQVFGSAATGLNVLANSTSSSSKRSTQDLVERNSQDFTYTNSSSSCVYNKTDIKFTYAYHNKNSSDAPKCTFPTYFAAGSRTTRRVAIASVTYNKAEMCGACLNVTVYGKWGKVIEQFSAIVDDECTDCSDDYGISYKYEGNRQAQPEHDISWSIVDCGDSTYDAFSYYIHPESTWMNVKFQISHTRTPLLRVSAIQNGVATALTRTADNWWVLASNTTVPIFPMQLQLVSVTGIAVTDSIAQLALGAPLVGGAQFPLRN